ncbi:hypothetical protein J1N35_037372, partial [Gossypium stocksii]
ISLACVAYIAWPRIHTPVWQAGVGPQTQLSLPCVAHTVTLEPPHGHVCTRPCPCRPHGLVSHTANYTGDHTLVWRRQNNCLAFVESSFFCISGTHLFYERGASYFMIRRCQNRE